MALDVTNNDRADWARGALDHFATLVGLDWSGDHAADPSITLGDLLCNLHHLARREGWDINAIFQGARGVFEEELAEEIADDA